MFDTLTRMGASAAGAYEIERSVRFDKTITDQSFDWTPSSDGNRKTWTLSCWLKRTKLPSGSTILSTVSGSLRIYIRFLYDQFDMLRWNGSSAAWQLRTDRLFRDTGSWYHIVVAFDTTQATASNRIKLYVNGGAAETSLDIANYPNQNTDWHVSQSGHEQSIGFGAFDGYITEVNFIDGQALDGSHFGETDSDTGQWIPKEFEGTYGSNGYFLNFADNSAATAAAIGKDSSGNGNNFTPDNVSVATTFEGDSFPDTPTNNMCVMNSVYNGDGGDSVIEKGGLHVDTAASSAQSLSSIGIPQSGKWFFEAKMTELNSEGSSTGWIGVASSSPTSTSQPRVAYYGYTGNKWIDDTGTTYGAAYTTNDVIGVAVNMDDSEITFYKNGTSQGVITSWRVTGNQYFFMVGDGGSAGSTEYELNFGQKAFLHSKPAGYKILTTNNLPEPTIKKGSDHFDTVTYTGTGGAQSETGLAFQPDLLWFKKRTNDTEHHYLHNSVSGADKYLYSNLDNAEATESIITITSNGWTQNNDMNSHNKTSDTYVAWLWKESATAGFDIVSYTGNGTSGNTVSHSLGVAPDVIFVKRRDAGNTWQVYHSGMGAEKFLELSSNYTIQDSTARWNDTAPTSSVFTLGDNANVNANNGTYIAYLWSGVEGYSKFGTYIGNGNSDGTFVFTGFKPACIITKTYDHTDGWQIWDSTRDPDNLSHHRLHPEADDVESTSISTSTSNLDILSNGFKWRGSSNDTNGSGNEYIYLAFAERPFKYANAR